MRKRPKHSVTGFLLPGSHCKEPVPALGDEKQVHGTEGRKLLPICSPGALRGLVASLGVGRDEQDQSLSKASAWVGLWELFHAGGFNHSHTELCWRAAPGGSKRRSLCCPCSPGTGLWLRGAFRVRTKLEFYQVSSKASTKMWSKLGPSAVGG